MRQVFAGPSALEMVDPLLKQTVHPIVWVLSPWWLFLIMFQEAARQSAELHWQDRQASLIELSRYRRQRWYLRWLISLSGQAPRVAPVCTEQDMLRYYADKLRELEVELAGSFWLYGQTARDAAKRCGKVAAYLA